MHRRDQVIVHSLVIAAQLKEFYVEVALKSFNVTAAPQFCNGAAFVIIGRVCNYRTGRTIYCTGILRRVNT
jgi:hypothetical protein